MKYIVKNCPALRKMIAISSAKRHETLFDSCSEGKHSLCADRTDCPIKLIVNECKKYSYIFSERGILASLILQILQVEEVEE
jgi:hypothetical protein